ncbi:MAG: hypothetical protein PHE53_12445, partial [Thermoguttaceae bacterium]|nr:hypothetical protein [Thermoguttaceae bacterium]
VFQNHITPYDSFVTHDIDENAYIFEVTAEFPEHAVALADEGVQETVTTAWKQIQSRELAEQEAAKLVKQVQDAKQPLRTVLADRELILPAPFAWMTQTNQYSQPYLTQVEGIDRGGETFMKSVFSLKAGETGTAWNQAKTVLYVVNVEELSPGDDLLWAIFPNSSIYTYWQNGMSDLSSKYLMWFNAFRKDCNFTWVDKPKEVNLRNERE